MFLYIVIKLELAPSNWFARVTAWLSYCSGNFASSNLMTHAMTSS